jgi:MFS family permease
MIRTARKSIIPLYAADVLGLNVGVIGSIMGASATVDVAVFYASGVIMDRWGRKFVTVPTFALQALGILLVPFTRSFAGLLFAATVVGLGNGIGAGSMMTLGSDLAPRERRAEFLGIWRLLGDAGQAASPVVVGGVAQLFVLPAAAAIIACSGFLASAVFALLVPETLRRERAARAARGWGRG